MKSSVLTSDRLRRTLPHGLALCLLAQAATVCAQEQAPTPQQPSAQTAQAPAQTGEQAPAQAAAGTEEIEEIVVSAAVIGTYHEDVSSMASKLPMNVNDLASSLQIMNETAIRDRNAIVLTDVFNYVVGATQTQQNINGFSFRGFPSTGSYTQNIQFDGLQGATQKKAALSATDVESLEFLKGPNGVLYGQMNPGGLLNIVSKSPQDSAHYIARVAMGFYAGQFTSGATNTADVSLDATGPLFDSDKVDYRLIVDGSREPNSRPGNDDHNISVYPSITIKFTDKTSLTIKGENSVDHRRQDDGLVPIFYGPTINVPIAGVLTPTAAYGSSALWYTAPFNTVYNNSLDSLRDYGSALSTFFHTEFAGWTLRAQSRSVFHIDDVNEWTVNNANVFSSTVAAANGKYPIPSTVLVRQYNHVKNAHRYNYIDANIYRAFGPDMFRNTVIVGVAGGGEGFFNQRLAFGPNATAAQAITLINPILDQYGYPAAGTGATDQRTWQDAFSQYIADQIKIGDILNISLGIRHDDQRTHGLNVLSPALTTFHDDISPYTKQAGIVWHIIPVLSAYASYSQSIKPQTTIAYDQNGNSNFPPEAGEQYEGGLKFEAPSKNLNVTLATYEINRTNVIVPSGTNFTVATGAAQPGQAISRLDGKQQSKGVETEVQWQPMKNWQIQGGFAYNKAIIAQSITNPYTVGLDLANAPRRTGNLWSRYNIPRGMFAGLGIGTGVVYVGQAWAGDPTTRLYYQLPGWTRVDASAYYTAKSGHYDISLNVQNLGDRRYIASAQSAQTLNVGEQRLVTLSFRTNFSSF